MGSDFTKSARRLGVTSAVGVVSLGVAYLARLSVGLATLPSAQDPIADPWFTTLELLILAMMPFMVTLMVSVHAWADRENKVWSMAALVFMTLVAVITFFSLSVLFAIPVFDGGRMENWIRILLGVSGGLALAGLAGVFLDDMQIRNIGIVGYAVVFPVAVALIGIVFSRADISER